jgi:hypothetical protein
MSNEQKAGRAKEGLADAVARGFLESKGEIAGEMASKMASEMTKLSGARLNGRNY